MAFSVFFNTVENHKELQVKGIPWLCDKCHCEDAFLLKMSIDYSTVVLCKKCLMGAKRQITDKEKEQRDGENISDDKTRRRSTRSDRRSDKKD